MADQAQRKPVGRRVAKPAGYLAIILAGVYAAEGGYTKDPKDPGGATNYGITERVARAHGYLGDMRYFPKRCEADTPTCADEIYIRDYIQAPGYMPMVTLDAAVADKLVNTAANTGSARPNRWFRETLGFPGITKPLGPADYAAYRNRQAQVGIVQTCEATLRSLGAKQEAEYLRLIRANHKLARFRNGWIARARNLHPRKIPCGAF